MPHTQTLNTLSQGFGQGLNQQPPSSNMNNQAQSHGSGTLDKQLFITMNYC